MEASYRGYKSDAAWWKDHLAETTNNCEFMLGVLALLKHAKSSVIVDLPPIPDASVGGLGEKPFRALSGLSTEIPHGTAHAPLYLQEALRLRTVRLSWRVLWLVWIIATESTREHISVHLEADIKDMFLVGTVYGRAAFTAAQTTRKLKLDSFNSA